MIRQPRAFAAPLALAALLLASTAVAARADAPVVEAAEARRTGDAWSISATVRHPDTGWNHYADGWRVEAEDGAELGFRELLHPHETEQPFTRSLSGVTIPEGTTRVVIRAHDSVHGWGEGFVLELDGGS